VSVVSLLQENQQRQFEIEAQEPARNVQTQEKTALLFNPKKQLLPMFKNNVSLMFYVPTPNEVVAQMLALRDRRRCDLRRQW